MRTQAPLHSVCPAGHAQVQLVWLRVWPPGQFVTHDPVPLQYELPAGQEQAQEAWSRIWPPVQAGTQPGARVPAVALQNAVPPGQTQVQFGPATWPP